MAAPARSSPSIIRSELLALLTEATDLGVTLVSAPAGSGKTVLLRSWLESSGAGATAAWVAVDRAEHDAQHFWLNVIAALRSVLGDRVGTFEPTPSFDGASTVERLLLDLNVAEQKVILVIDDLHELLSAEAREQLEFLLSRRPDSLRIVLSSRHEPRLGLHRLRLGGELAELRAEHLRFTPAETRELLGSAGVSLPDESLHLLYERTEGWAAGLRLAALALTGHPAPTAFIRSFSGSERTIAEYLIAEVLQRQPAEVSRLLTRTSILDRVNASLADVLNEAPGSLRVLHELEEQNAFVVATDPGRQWFRYHHLFGELLRLELERAEPERIVDLHHAAAVWLEQHDDIVAAVGHYQLAGEWQHAADLVAHHGASLALDGRAAAVRALLARFPASTAAHMPELALMLAQVEVLQGSLADAETYVQTAERVATAAGVEDGTEFKIALGLARLLVARRRGDFANAVDEAGSLLAAAAPGVHNTNVQDDLRATALTQLGMAEIWSWHFQEAERHLEQGLDAAQQSGRAYLQVQAMAHLSMVDARRSLAAASARAQAATLLAQEHGWEDDQVIGPAMVALASVAVWQGRFEEAEQLLARAGRLVDDDLDPGTGLLFHLSSGRLYTARGDHKAAATEFAAAARLEALLDSPQLTAVAARRLLGRAQLLLGDTTAARATLSDLHTEELNADMARTAAAYTHLSDGDPAATVTALAPVIDGSLPSSPMLLVEAVLLNAVALDQLGDRAAAEQNVERALELAAPDGLIWPFVVMPVEGLLERHPHHMTRHIGLLNDARAVKAGAKPTTPDHGRDTPPDQLSDAELRVLRYLPTNLSAPEIAAELYLSTYTVKTHVRHIYEKLGVHARRDAVERARSLGLLGSSATAGQRT